MLNILVNIIKLNLYNINMLKISLAFLFSILTSFIIMQVILRTNKQAKQTILKYVKEHSKKNGTPTMGGVLFIINILLIVFIFVKPSRETLVVLSVFFAYSVLGFLDDFIKIKFKQNLGLLPYQKIAGQVLISLILAIYVYSFKQTSILIPFVNVYVDFGFFIVPFVIIVCLAFTNSVNLIDGLDGLCCNVSAVFIPSLITLLLLTNKQNLNNNNLITILVIVLASIFVFLLYNTSKASIFMGDVGSLGLGGLYSSVMIVSGTELFALTLGIMFVVTSLSVILQVFVYKRTKKRVFLMSPLHHHFQMKGYSEPKIAYTYSFITLIISIITISTLL